MSMTKRLMNQDQSEKNSNKQKISDSKAWMKLWKVANKFEMKDLAEKCMERIAVRNCLLSTKEPLYQQGRSNLLFASKKLTNPFLECLILCGHTNTCKGCIEKICSDLNWKCLICGKDIDCVNNAYF